MLTGVLRFEEEGHRYYLGERQLPSVTQVLEPIQMLEGIPRDVLDAAADLGRKVHLACHFLDMGVLDWSSLDDVLTGYVEAYRKFLRETHAVVLASEQKVAHAKHGYAGTYDMVALLPRLHANPQRMLIDRKSATTMPRTVGPQTSAYLEAELSNGNPLGLTRATVRAGLLLKPDGTYSFKPLKVTDHAADFNMFISCLNVHRWRNQL